MAFASSLRLGHDTHVAHVAHPWYKAIGLPHPEVNVSKNADDVLQEHTSIIHISSIIVARRPVYVRLALWFLHHPAWMEGHTGGLRLTPTVHPCPVQLGSLWVAYVVYEPNTPQEHAQLAHGSGARVQDHDPDTNQPASPDDSIETIGTGHGCCRADAETVSRTAAEQATTPK